MSVILLDVKNKCMYSDTVVTYGSATLSNCRKTRYHELQDGRYRVLIGGVGSNTVITMLMAFVLDDINSEIEKFGKINCLPSFSIFSKTPEKFSERVSSMSHFISDTEFQSEVLVFVHDTLDDEIHVGIMESINPIIFWDMYPSGTEEDVFCLGSQQTVACWNGTSGSFSERLSRLLDSINFLKLPNKVEKLDIDGKLSEVVCHSK